MFTLILKELKLQMLSNSKALKVLVTGFEPFLQNKQNSSWAVAEKVAAFGVDNTDIVIEQLPVSFFRVGGRLREVVKKHSPNIIVLLGQSGGIDYVKVERVALNLMDAQKADNDGYIPDEEPININAPTALFTSTPIKSLVAEVERKGIPVKLSNSCGLYVCNRTYYEVLTICQENSEIQAIFVHLPYYKGQTLPDDSLPTLSLNTMAEAIKIIIEKLTF
jgi:pyroglutamyl-peptidase